ncbi:AAA family ATPase [Arthrobacter sp. JZ12]|uniref:DUF4011 domain-containing protein n=1 Tax=Arthrobacter sp. JZ12 TaxID=2654190 RepID=UPI002B47D849|nr:DUF4011 domain-containing protein [Arthrobacter sp. JZ12]WRH25528.1 AAA family ATPase [Arthrobacter sp. JZ12]
MPIWSRSGREAAGKRTTVPVQDAGDSAEDFLIPWLRRLGPHAGSDTLLHFTPSRSNSIDLTHAHPSGLAQLLAGRRTRLSTLLRDPDQYGAAMKAARLLRAKVYELASERGIDVGYVAAGTASWRSIDDAGRTDSLTAPVLLTAVSLTVHSSQDDYELQLTEQARLNPALVRTLQRDQGIDFDADAVARLAYSTARFDPHPVLDRLRALTDNVRGMTIEHHILVSTFADLADVGSDAAVRPEHPLLSALMEAAREGIEAPSEAEAPIRETPLDDRHPSTEFLILDADTSQQRVLDAVAAGGSLVVSSPPGTGQTQTALNAAASLAEQGKSVLVVAERRGTLNEFVQQLDALNLGSLVLQLNANGNAAQLKDQLIRAIVRNEKAGKPKLDSLHETLVSHRHKLLDHVRSLHNVRSRWGCSPYQAMQSLAELTSLSPAPATTVRLKRSVMDSIPNRTELTGRLRRAAELGGFSREATQSPWYGARLRNRKETEHAHSLAVDLARDIPELRNKVLAVAEHSHIELGATFEEWGGQLDLLVAVRASLDKFTPDIFDRPVTDLISATAPSSWRRERTIEMSSMTRSRLRRVAKEYVRPGVHISDLHQSLVEVQEQRTLWTRYAKSERHPSVPTGLAEINSSYRKVQQQLAELTSILAGTPARPELSGMALDELAALLEKLAEDKQSLATLPERTLLLDEMRENGLGELLDDLAAREVSARQVGAELELAWWQSALEAMISGDDYLAMSDGGSLRTLEAEYRLADNAHVASGAARIRWALSERWRGALETMPAEAEQLRSLLRAGEPDLEALCSQADELVTALMPVWAASPLVLPLVLPQGKTFDAVIVLDAESISLQSVVPALARSRQVIAFGDDHLGGPRSFTVSVEEQRRTGQEHLPSAYRALAAVLPSLSLRDVYRGVDRSLTAFLNERFYEDGLNHLPAAAVLAGTGRGFEVEYLPDGTGMPSSDHDGVESVAAEVTRVVDLVFEHIRQRPSHSLAVVTASARHAQRVGEAVRLAMADAPWAADFFKPGPESFRIVPVGRAAGLTRDAVIFSLGFGRTPHGRALHNFGPLSAPDGRGQFVTAMTRARYRLHVLTCFRPGDLDPERLGHGARDFYELLLRELSQEVPPTGEVDSDAVSDDPLVADLMDRLRHRGAEVRGGYEGVLDIAARASDRWLEPGRDAAIHVPPVAIESDGSERYRSMTVRERSRLRPQLLERQGWRYVPLWTIEVFTDPEGCADLIADYLGLERADAGNPVQGAGEPVVQSGVSVASGADEADLNGPTDASEEAAESRQDEVVDVEAAESGAGEAEEDAAPKPAAAQPSSPASTATAPHGDVLPQRAAEDDPRSWNDDESNHDEWLKEQKPPHWS